MLPNNLMNIEETDNSIDYNKQREVKDIKIDTWRKNRRRHGDRRSTERERWIGENKPHRSTVVI